LRDSGISILWGCGVAVVGSWLISALGSPCLLERDRDARHADDLAALNQQLLSSRDECSTLSGQVMELQQRLTHSPAQQHLLEKAQASIRKLGPDAITMLRHLHVHETLTFGLYNPQLPAGIGGQAASAILNQCAEEGLVSKRGRQRGGMIEYDYVILPALKPLLDELLYDP
jgi:hypothetical protein